MFGVFALLAFIHVFFCFPETKGLTLEEVEDVFDMKGSAFRAWRKVPPNITKGQIIDDDDFSASDEKSVEVAP